LYNTYSNHAFAFEFLNKGINSVLDPIKTHPMQLLPSNLTKGTQRVVRDGSEKHIPWRG